MICAKNEAKDLSQNLPYILMQNHSSFEVIVVNDFSTDKTSEIVYRFQKQFDNLRLIHSTDKDSISKRSALKYGVKNSKYDVVLFTDADCRPISKNWITLMLSKLSKDANCVLGYSPYIAYQTFLNYIIQFETLQTAVLYFSKAIQNQAYMAVGRNVMYRKSTFLESENFEFEHKLRSGDDDLLIQNIKDKSKINVSLDNNSFVLSRPKLTWTSWWKQKQRHYTTAPHYQWSFQLFLGAYYAFHCIFWLSFILLYLSSYSLLSLSAFWIYLLGSTFIWIYFAKLFKVSWSVMAIWPILQLTLLMLQTCMGLQSLFRKQTTWQ